MIFVDTSAWAAIALLTDAHHEAAKAWHATNDARLVTTDYILDEVLTLLRMRGNTQAAKRLAPDLLHGTVCHFEWVTPADVHAAWKVFDEFSDKKWSFTDCVSKVVMEELQIQTAFAFDDHFRQFGNVHVVPEAP